MQQLCCHWAPIRQHRGRFHCTATGSSSRKHYERTPGYDSNGTADFRHTSTAHSTQELAARFQEPTPSAAAAEIVINQAAATAADCTTKSIFLHQSTTHNTKGTAGSYAAAASGSRAGRLMNNKALSRWLVIVACLRLLSGDPLNTSQQQHARLAEQERQRDPSAYETFFYCSLHWHLQCRPVQDSFDRPAARSW